jgi:hypothetical protein
MPEETDASQHIPMAIERTEQRMAGLLEEALEVRTVRSGGGVIPGEDLPHHRPNGRWGIEHATSQTGFADSGLRDQNRPD